MGGLGEGKAIPIPWRPTKAAVERIIRELMTSSPEGGRSSNLGKAPSTAAHLHLRDTAQLQAHVCEGGVQGVWGAQGRGKHFPSPRPPEVRLNVGYFLPIDGAVPRSAK